MTFLAGRSRTLELMDSEPVGLAELSHCLRDLERLNDFYVGALGLSLIKRSFNQDDSRTRHCGEDARRGGADHPKRAREVARRAALARSRSRGRA